MKERLRLSAENLEKMARDDTERELARTVTKEILDQFSSCVENLKKMTDMYPLVKATVTVALQIRVCGEEQITCLAGVGKTLKDSLLDMTFQTMAE